MMHADYMDKETIRPQPGFAAGDRVSLNELGRARSPKMRSLTGTVISISGRRYHVVFDGNKTFTRLHESYLQPAPVQEKVRAAAAS